MNRLFFSFTVMLAASSSNIYAICTQASDTLNLNNDWEFSQSFTGQWYDATVPGTVHQDLIDNDLLPNPFYGLNEQRIQWVEGKDWEYKTSFNISENQLQRDAAQLTFEGLDTYADVYLNGSLILKSDNMFVGHTVDVKQNLRKGENRLHVRFRSPIVETMPQWESNGFDYPADNDHYPQHLSVFTRKAPYSFGWDWGIRMVTCGIWRPVYLSFFDVASIEDFHVKQLSLTDDKASINNIITINNIKPVDVEVNISVSYSLKGGKETSYSVSKVLAPGENRVHIPFEIANPQRWMPNGWGEPTLYDFMASIECNGTTVSMRKERIGFRTLRVVNEKDEHGESFYFEVNGIPMFAKGANYIPHDILLPNISAKRYADLFRDIKAANMNMIRVWGGGTYEDNRFYSLADENGILIWQDFMFACTSYPADSTFLKRVKAEADYNIRRLRNHPCLAMWCGNNEILEGMKYWGWQKRYTPAQYKLMQDNYNALFNILLPAKVKELDEERFYVNSSPYMANWGRPATWGFGDSHNWGIWYGQKPFESSDTEFGRFQSEYGFESFPEMKTIATFAAPDDYAITSPVMSAHQKSSQGNDLIRTYMQRDYIVPERFEDFVYVGMVLQGHGIRHCIEAHRRNRPYCMGTLYWQLNDSWPVVSWSGIDYYGNWKALHYQAKRAFEPILINPLNEGNSVKVYLISDKLSDSRNLTLDMQLTDFNGKVLNRKKCKVDIESNCSKCVYTSDVNSWGNEQCLKKSFLLLTLTDKAGNQIAREVHYFNKTKDLALHKANVSMQIKTFDGKCEVTLKSSTLAKDVFVQIPFHGARFSDNFFDILPGEKRVITITSPEIKHNENPEIILQHIRQTYN